MKLDSEKNKKVTKSDAIYLNIIETHNPNKLLSIHYNKFTFFCYMFRVDAVVRQKSNTQHFYTSANSAHQ